MDRTFTFATVAAYRSAKQSNGTAEIYNALIPSSSTGSTVNVARSVVSYIAELGRSVVDSVNVCVPYEQGGFVGDVLYYNSTYGYFWMKSPRSTWSADAIGQTYYDPATMPASFVRVGFCFLREGRHGLICNLTSTVLAWSTDTSTTVPSIFTSTTIANGIRINTWIAGVKEAAEAVWGSSYYQYSWPLPRTVWDTVVANIKSRTAGSGGTANQCTWTVTKTANGDYQGLITAYGTQTMTNINPADYDYNFDRWYRENVEAAIPGPVGTVTALRNASGVNNDGLRNTQILYETGNSPAANHAVAYSVNAPKHGAGKWWIPTAIEMIRLAKVYPELNKNGAGFSTSYAYWTSDQYNSTDAWGVNLNNGLVNHYTKTNGYQVRLVSAFEL